jgi:glycosyltransferase involved in cell wall biosynthesis
MTDVTVITPTRSGREVVLLEAVDSVQAQTHPAAAHFVGLDADRAGPAAMRNALLGEVLTPLVAFLDDDDLLDPAHLETLLSEMERSGADVAQGRNVIPVTVLARLDAINEAGGFQSADRYEDYSLWCRMLDLGARFSLVKRETWTYRFLDDNRTWEGS